MIYFYSLLVLFIFHGISHGKSIKKSHANLLEPFATNQSWDGKWFPHAPGEKNENYKEVQRVHPPTTAKTTSKDEWQGLWFPHKPGQTPIIVSSPKHINEKFQSEICDDGKYNVGKDYASDDVRENINYLCITSNRSNFDPNMSKFALLTEHFLPPAFVPDFKCLNESIEYNHYPPTNGAFRPIPAVYGTYTYLPPQRYLRNLAEGAIVMLYHPCAYNGQVEQLRNIVSGCLYRHIITPSRFLTAERPIALLAWSKILTMSVVDKRIVSQFIRSHAMTGPLAQPNLARELETRDTYKTALLSEARLVTDLNDSELCGYQEM